MMVGKKVLELVNIDKAFGAVNALSGIQLSIQAGEVIALVGDNGAGKSTLVKIAAGVMTPDQGDILFNGEAITFRGPMDATKAGIAVIYQDLALCDNLSVVSNLFLGREIQNGLPLAPLNEEEMEAKVLDLLQELNVGQIKDIDIKVGNLSGGQRQTIAIARSLIGDPKVVLLDEPTAALGVAQKVEVLKLIRRLADRGIGVLVISHNISEVLEVSDRVVVLRLGKVVANFETKNITSDDVVSAITGSKSFN
jgi:D-xylose transport system ATP-binding protein